MHGIPAGTENAVNALLTGFRQLKAGRIVALAPEGRVPRRSEREEGLSLFLPGVGLLACANAEPVLLFCISQLR